MSSDAPVVARFCPSPTGNPHVGMARTALFSWAFARHHGGRFVFRIEDTDASRDTEESYDLLIDVMRWLGLDWDEGPEVGGPNGPYRQSERMDIYADVAQQLLDAGLAYKAYDTAEELEERREKAARRRPPERLRRPAPRPHAPSSGRRTRPRAASPSSGSRCREQDWTFNDLVRGDITFDADNVQDYVLVRANGQPLYTLTNPTDDAMMGITHVLRGEDLLSSTPRQIALYEAFAEIGIGGGSTPEFGHLPFVMGAGNRKLSKRDPESNLLGYRAQGLPARGPAQLPGAARLVDRRRPRRLLPRRDGRGVRDQPGQPQPGAVRHQEVRGDQRLARPPAAARRPRATAWCPTSRLPACSARRRPLNSCHALEAAAPLVHERMTLLTEAVDMLRFLFVADDDFVVDEADRAKQLDEAGLDVVRAAHGGAGRRGGLVDRVHRGGAARRPHRRPRAQAASRRSGPCASP